MLWWFYDMTSALLLQSSVCNNRCTTQILLGDQSSGSTRPGPVAELHAYQQSAGRRIMDGNTDLTKRINVGRENPITRILWPTRQPN